MDKRTFAVAALSRRTVLKGAAGATAQAGARAATGGAGTQAAGDTGLGGAPGAAGEGQQQQATGQISGGFGHNVCSEAPLAAERLRLRSGLGIEWRLSTQRVP